MNTRAVFMAAAAAVVVLAAAGAPARARERTSERPKPKQYFPQTDIRSLDIDLDGLATSAAVDTYNIVRYDFEPMDWQGWTRRDYTAQRDTFFHVDDFSGLGGGDYGRLFPVEGSKSAWCGARPSGDWYLCNWRKAPGYGDNWDQYLTTGPIYFTGKLKISYHGRFDSEPGLDRTTVELYDSYGVKAEIACYDGVVDTIAEHSLYLAAARTKIRFHFTSDSGWSDDDGLRNSDGAAIIDSITIEDETGVLDFEDFESAAAGAKESGIHDSEGVSRVAFQ
jgi:hypothetical protein